MGSDKAEIGHQTGRSVLNNIISFLERHRETMADKPALLWVRAETKAGWLQDRKALPAHEAMTYGELANKAESAASGLKELGLGFGDRVFIFLPMSPELYVAMFAVQRIGAVAVFLDSWARRDQLGSCVKQVMPRGFIAPEPAFSLLRGLMEQDSAAITVVTGPHDGEYTSSLERLCARGKTCPLCPMEREDNALITFTTGSSGPPKGACRTHRFLASQHRALNECIPYEDEDIDLPVFPIFSLNNLAGGVTTILPAIDLAHPTESDGAMLVAQLEAGAATCCTLSPSLLLAVVRTAGELSRPLNGLRRTATGGAPISPDDVVAFMKVVPKAELEILYGSTEVEPIAHLVAKDMPDESEGKGVCVGAISKGLEYRLICLHKGPVELSEKGWEEWEAPFGEAGELVVSGDHVCRDYYNNPEAFKSSKIRDGENRIWHRTGDVCCMDDKGRFWIVGRLHNAICRDKRYLFPVRPEVIMKRLSFVRAAAYVGLPDEALGERAVAVFSVRPDSAPGNFTEHVRGALESEGIVVDRVTQVDSIPLDPRHHSKVEYGKLREQLLAV